MSSITELFPTPDGHNRLPRGQIVRQKWQTLEPPPHEFAAILCPEEEGGFSVFALNYPGVFSQGETREEAKSNIAEAFLAMLESRQKYGEKMEFSGHSVVEESPGSERIRVVINA